MHTPLTQGAVVQYSYRPQLADIGLHVFSWECTRQLLRRPSITKICLRDVGGALEHYTFYDDGDRLGAATHEGQR